jgi:hypothetical protein
MRKPFDRPDPDEDHDLSDVRSTAVSVENERLPERLRKGGEVDRPQKVPAPHAGRFGFMLGALIAFGLAGIVGAVLMIGGGDNSKPSMTWSTWKPDTDAVTQGAEEIAAHIGAQYHLTTGEQLVAVTGGPLEIAGLKMQIAQQSSVSQGGGIQILNGKGVLYRLCGLGENCAIPKGTPSSSRHLLLRREALELAVYSFRYLRGIDDVVVFLPPRMGEQPSQALHFRRKDVETVLDHPLTSSLQPKAPTPSQVRSTPDSSLVEKLTAPKLSCFRFAQANQDTSVFLVLEPIDPVQGCPTATADGSGSSSGSATGG